LDKLKIVVATGEDLILAIQETFLRRSDCRLMPASDVDQTLALALRERPDLVVLDGDEWGDECCRLLKLDSRLAETPVLLIASPPTAEAGTLAPYDGLVPRPIETETLMREVRRFIAVPERRSSRRPASLRVHYACGDDWQTAYTKDLGRDGLFLRGRLGLSHGRRVQLLFDLPTSERPTVRATAEVVRAVGPSADSHLIPGHGLRWLGLSERDRADLERFVVAGQAPA
jgi:hypothetical protein